jgi:hypothetical protein
MDTLSLCFGISFVFRHVCWQIPNHFHNESTAKSIEVLNEC